MIVQITGCPLRCSRRRKRFISFKKYRFVLQVDYESEDGENSGEEDQEEVTGQPEENVGSEELAEARNDNSQPSVQENADGDTLDSMRVSKVLQFSPMIEAYRYDQQKDLWCEVRSRSAPCSIVNVDVRREDSLTLLTCIRVISCVVRLLLLIG